MRHEHTELHLYFIRHALSHANLRADLVGGTNLPTPLTEHGHWQADALGRRLAEDGVAFDLLFVSPAVRTRQTAEGIVKHVPCGHVFTADDLVEIGQGEWEGRPRSECHTPESRRAMAEKHIDFAAPGGESIRMVQRRAANWLEDNLIENPAILNAGGIQHFGIVSHGITIKSLIQYIMGVERSLVWRIDLGNTSICHFKFNARGWWPLTLNDTAHLRGLTPEPLRPARRGFYVPELDDLRAKCYISAS